MTLTHLGEQWLDRWLDENAMLFWWRISLGSLRKRSLPMFPVRLTCGKTSGIPSIGHFGS
jgi:hypothetical protein